MATSDENPPLSSSIPTIDFAPFINGDTEKKKLAMEIICKACQTTGFFRIINHGMPLELMARAIELSKSYFDLPYLKKLEGKAAAGPEGFRRAGYNQSTKNEYLLMYSHSSGYNIYPREPVQFREILGQCFTELKRMAQRVEIILSEALGLPSTFLHDHNSETGPDAMAVLHYHPPINNQEQCGLAAHHDGNYFTFVFEDDVGGLEVQHGESWIPVVPVHGSITVNIGDALQVLSNDTFKSAMHRVVMRGRRSRHSYAFFRNVDQGKWIQPLREFTGGEGGEQAKYRGFHYREYLQLKEMINKRPTASVAEEDDPLPISYFINSSPSPNFQT